MPEKIFYWVFAELPYAVPRSVLRRVEPYSDWVPLSTLSTSIVRSRTYAEAVGVSGMEALRASSCYFLSRGKVIVIVYPSSSKLRVLETIYIVRRKIPIKIWLCMGLAISLAFTLFFSFLWGLALTGSSLLAVGAVLSAFLLVMLVVSFVMYGRYSRGVYVSELRVVGDDSVVRGFLGELSGALGEPLSPSELSEDLATALRLSLGGWSWLYYEGILRAWRGRPSG